MAKIVTIINFKGGVGKTTKLADFPQPEIPQRSMRDKPLTEDELKRKTVPELKKIAKDLNITTAGKKDDLVRKILARSVSGRSEQFAIQDV